MNNNNHSSPQTDDEIRAELEDRLMDQNLEELLGSSRIPITAHVAAPSESKDSTPQRVSLRRRRFYQVLGVVCPLLILGVIWQVSSLNSWTSSSDESVALSPSTVANEPLDPQSSEKFAEGDLTYLNDVNDSLQAEGSVQILNESSSMRDQPTSPTKVFPVGDLVAEPEQALLQLPSAESPRGGQQKFQQGRNVYYPNQSGGRPATSGSKALSGDGTAPADSTPSNSPVIQSPSSREESERIVSEDRKKNTDLQLGFGAYKENSNVPILDLDNQLSKLTETNGVLTTELNQLKGRGPGDGGENYAPIYENPFQVVTDEPLSTFSIDVDTASYSNVRRMLSQNRMLPPPDAVRIEELVNYFNYSYPAPVGDDPFSVNVDQTECPWQPKHQLVRIGLKGKEIPLDERPASNLVFLLDVSGSMKSDNKLPLLKDCLKMMVDYLTENDSVSIVVYAQASGMVLPPTSGDNKATIMGALDSLHAGGSTNGGEGIQLAYKTAVDNYIKGGINRVILATDGDFNVGTTSDGDLQRLIEEKAKSGVFLTTLGFGYGNLQDNKIELLANKGNGSYAYIDTLREGRKVLIDEMGSTLNTIAKDVKIQIEFNPVKVAAYRLLGYENRLLENRDFNDDTIDAGEIGAGHTVTALYELIPAGKEPLQPEVDELEFQKPQKPTKAAKDGDIMLVKLRYKQPDGDTSSLLKLAVPDASNRLNEVSPDFQFASQVASFGMLLRGSKYSGVATYDSVLEIAQSNLGENPASYRTEFIELVKLAKQYDRRGGRPAQGNPDSGF